MILSIPGSGTMGTGTVQVHGYMGTGTSPACQESRVRVRDRVPGYRYTNFCIRISIMSTGIMGKGTTSLLS